MVVALKVQGKANEAYSEGKARGSELWRNLTGTRHGVDGFELRLLGFEV